jgi:hypothetical protein
MDALDFWKRATKDRSNFFESLFDLLDRSGIRFCVIGGYGVSAYVEPLFSLDLDLVVAGDQLALAASTLGAQFDVTEVPGRLDVSSPGSLLRVHVHTDPRYLDFVSRASRRDILGLQLPVATPEDLVRGLTCSPNRMAILDIQRIVESFPHLREHIPAAILDRFA